MSMQSKSPARRWWEFYRIIMVRLVDVLRRGSRFIIANFLVLALLVTAGGVWLGGLENGLIALGLFYAGGLTLGSFILVFYQRV